MKSIRILSFSLILFATLLNAQNQKPLTLEDIFASDKFQGRTVVNIQWQPNGSAFTFTKRNPQSGQLDIYKHAVSSGEETLLLAGADLIYNNQPVNMSRYRWTPDGKYLVISGPITKIWRHSTQAPHYLYELATRELTPLADADPELRNVKLSPDGKWVGYVRDHNIYIVELATSKTRAITTDGTENILNGEFDWVYEEEFSIDDGWRWSPDSKKIAFWRLDQTRVKEFNLVDELAGVYNEVFKLKYPKAGEKNALVQIGVADITTGETTRMELGEETDIYIPRIHWTKSSNTLAIQRLNRQQNRLELLLADTNTGNSRTILADTDTAWVEVTDDVIFLKKQDQFLWTSERSGYRHIYRYDLKGNLVKRLTSGDWVVNSVAGVDEQAGWVYFYGKKDLPLEHHVYRVRLNGKGLQRISQREGWHSGVFAPDFKHVIGFFSDVRTPTQMMLRKADGSLVRFLEKNDISAVEEYRLAYPEFLTVTTTDGTKLNAYMIKPHDFDPNKKYPVLVFGYGGPGSQMVVNRWGTGGRAYHVSQRTLWHSFMVQNGYLVFCIDNRGTGGRGKAFKNLAYGDLSKWSVHDQIEGAEYLQTLPYVDGDRIGFWGWSGGGYLALMLMMRGPDYFKVGVSVAPVTDFHFYDTIWTERYMGHPKANIEGYEAANVLNYVDGLKGKLLVVHGTGDDNVHVQNTLYLIDELVAKDKSFDLMMYPNRNHRISGGNTQLHLFRKITEYFLENL